MAETITLTDRQEIRDWVAGRSGFPAIVDISPVAGTQPMLRLVFGQHAYQDQDQPERPPNAGGVELVEWDEWFTEFEKQELMLVVGQDHPGQRENSYQILRR